MVRYYQDYLYVVIEHNEARTAMMVGMARTSRVQCDHRFKVEARLHIRFVYPGYSIYI